jgi:ATP-dependent Clp protease ATP-binding subunit ClpA
MSDFDHYMTRVIAGATAEARAEGTGTVEAHHLLLAIARDGSSPALAAAGLDHAAVRAALDREVAQSLAAAGVHLEGGPPRATPAPEGSPQLGATARAALERGLGAAPRKRDCRPPHVLLGVVLAPVGTVPRALALTGVDRETLAESVRREAAEAL